MKQVVTGHDGLFGPWLMGQLDGEWFDGRGSTIGLFDQQTGIVGAVLFESSNGASCLLHCAGVGKQWLNREFLWYVFHYPFEELGVRKILSPVESDNLASRRFIENIGFTLEATLKDAAPKGDLLIYSMSREACKWLSLRGKYRGKTQSTQST